MFFILDVGTLAGVHYLVSEFLEECPCVIPFAVVRCRRDHSYESSPNCLFSLGVDRCAAGARGRSNEILLLSGVRLV